MSVHDSHGIAATIQRALSAAGASAATNSSAYVNDTISRALSSAGLVRQGTPARATVSSPLPAPRGKSGEFIQRSYSSAEGALAYKLYIPASGDDGEPKPLVVMLHGCTQDPDDFAAGTRMNQLADEAGCFVVYPAQTAHANGAKCWNWFNPMHQAADRGEPSLIVGIAREVASMYPVDEKRIFVAGLSAGAAMAVILGNAYPEFFAAIGAHSGLPVGAASDLPSALAAMSGRAKPPARQSEIAPIGSARLVPTIVFHGDRDMTVSPQNGPAIVSAALGTSNTLADPLTKIVMEREPANGRDHTRTIYQDSTRRPLIEQWELHGAGHAWSGGSSGGSYTDAAGPDASAQMLRFFLAQKSDG
jgi:poly(hydroxyalkanoate) depolymerase family esterase